MHLWFIKPNSKCSVTQSCPTLCKPSLTGSSIHGDSPGKNTGVGCHALLQGILATQGSNPGLPHCRCILYCLNHQGSLRIWEWVAYHFGEGNGTQLQYSCLENPMDGGAGWAAVHGVTKSRTRLSDFTFTFLSFFFFSTFTFHFNALEKEMATHSSVLAWRIPGIGEPGGLPSMGSHRVGHNWSDLAAAAAAYPGELPESNQDLL